MIIELELNGLNCVNCAEKIEKMASDLKGVESSNLNFVTKKLKINLKDIDEYEETKDKITKIVKELEPEVEVIDLSDFKSIAGKLELELNGLNCTDCARKIEEKTSELKGVETSKFNFVTKKMDINLKDMKYYNDIYDETVKIVKELEPGVEIIELSHSNSKEKMELELNGLNCTDCARKIEEKAIETKGVQSASFNFVTKKMEINLIDSSYYKSVYNEVRKIVNELEPEVEVLDITDQVLKNKELNLKLEGLNCADCAAKIEKFTHGIKGVENVDYDILSNVLKVEIRNDIKSFEVKEEIEDIVLTLEPDVEVIDLREVNKSKKKKPSLMERIDKKSLRKIIISGVIAFIPWLFSLEGTLEFILYFTAYLIIGNKVIIQAYKNVRAGVPFDENFLMTIATIAAFIIGEYPEAVMVMLLYQVGELMQGIAVNHSRDSITALMDIRPDYANLKRNGEIIIVDPQEVKIGDEIVIRPGERVPLDGKVIEGKSSLDTSNITGESVPRTVSIGDEILSGVVNLQGLLTIKVEKEFGESTISQVLDLVENASSQKAETENFITRFSRYYTPAVVFIAIFIALIPPIFLKGEFYDWLYRASVFLVISCPCALVISVPLGFFGGLGGASKAGILVKGGNYLEALSHVDTVVFDKTGTVTEGVFEVTEIISESNYSEEELLEIAAYGEVYSNHPIGISIVNKYGKEIDESRLSDYEDIPGKGIDVKLDGREILLGNKSLLESNNITLNETKALGTIVYIAEEGKHIGTIIVSDRIKSNAKEALERMKSVGVKNTIMLSGDNIKTVEGVGETLNIDEVHGELLPQDKVKIFEEILERKEGNKKVAFVGDGVNDAPVLARADVGIAMGGLGSDAAIEASDIVIMTDDIDKISTGINISRNTRKIVTQNIILALGVKLIVLILGAMGEASMWQAVFADVGVSIIAILNSIRALNVKKDY